jgi:N-acetylneuraminic acid mutarotase
MASAEHGYEDERFSHSVSAHFHCGICYNVLKEPVTCQRNEHYYCRACITEHLKNSPTCPTCQEGLSPETITQAPRILRNCLDELSIRCDNSDRGCQEIVQLAQLQDHVDVCGFAPVVCPNEGCLVKVNRQDLAGHQQALCQFRKCCDCSELKKVVHEINANTNDVNNQMKDLKSLKDINESLVAVKEEVSKTREDTNQVLHRLEALEEQVRATKETQEAMKEAQSSNNSGETYQPQNILVAGGRRTDFGEMKLVEIFNLSGMSWSPLQQMNESRVGASVFISNGEITVAGGNTNHGPTETLTKISISQDMKSASWSEVAIGLPTMLYGHTSVLYDGTLAHIGGCNKNKNVSKSIYRESVVRAPGYGFLPYSMPDPRCFHGTEAFDDKAFIFGGQSSAERNSCLDSVISLGLKERQTKQLASLPYPVSEMATVRWGDNVILIGGADQYGKPLATVVIYNIKTERWHILPSMNEKRKACSAVVVQDMIIVMGGRTQNNTCLCSVECFTFKNYSWQNFPVMITARERAVAVAF